MPSSRLSREMMKQAAHLCEGATAIVECIDGDAREIEVLEHARSTNGGPLDEGAITRLFERIIDEARRLERSAAKERER